MLTAYQDGIWRTLTVDELRTFINNNPRIADYMAHPEQLANLNIPPIPPSAVLYDHWNKAATKIITNLWKMPGAFHFHSPVDYVALNIPDYPQIITHPMDLGTIKEKLSTCKYNNCREFVNDMELVFSNCIKYNTEVSDFGVLAMKLRDEFKNQCQLVYLDYYM